MLQKASATVKYNFVFNALSSGITRILQLIFDIFDYICIFNFAIAFYFTIMQFAVPSASATE